MLPLTFVDNIFSFEGARSEKGLKKASNLNFFKNVKTEISIFLIFSKNSFRNELQAAFLPFF